MPQFTYFIEGVSKAQIKAGVLASMGLGYALDDRAITRDCKRGPGERGGIVVQHNTDTLEAQLPAYRAEGQTWKRYPASLLKWVSDKEDKRIFDPSENAVWCGYENNAVPKPVDLQRKDMLRGHPMALGDGQTWLCPVARAWVEADGEGRWQAALPLELQMSDEGVWTSNGFDGKYGHLWEIAGSFLTAFFQIDPDAETPEMTITDAAQSATIALAANYRVGIVELSMLGTIKAEEHYMKILQALVDWPSLQAFQKKSMEGTGVPQS